MYMKLISDKIIEELKSSLCLDLMAEKERNELLTEILEVISKKASAKILKGFSDSETQEFNKIPKDNLEAMENFMIEKNPRSVDIFEETAHEINEKLLNSNINVSKNE